MTHAWVFEIEIFYCSRFRKTGVRYIYYTQMFLLAVAMILLTLFMLWIRKLTGECYHSLNLTGTPPDAFLYDEEFCEDKVSGQGEKSQI